MFFCYAFLMIKSRKQTGSGLAVVSIVIIAVILGALGYVLWNNLSSKSAIDQQTNAAQRNETEEDSGGTSSEGYVVINEWGVKFPIVNDLKSMEVQYNQRESQDEPSQTYYVFTTARIQSLGGQCAKQPLGDTAILYQYAEKPIATPDGELVNKEAINGYYYVLSSPIAACSTVGEDGKSGKQISQVEVADKIALQKSIRKLIALE